MWVEGGLNYAKQNRKMRRSAENLDNVPKKKTNKQATIIPSQFPQSQFDVN